MAVILVTTFTNMPGKVLDNFRQGFVDSLVEEGNTVVLLKSNDFMESYQDSNRLAPGIDSQRLTDEIRGLKPDAIVSMNHSGIYPGLLEALNIKTAVWLLDGPAYLVEPDVCRKNFDRYQMCTPVSAFQNDLIKDFGYKPDNIHYLPFCSDFSSAKLLQTQNISFIGTFFTGHRLAHIIRENLSNEATHNKLQKLIGSYEGSPDLEFSERVRQHDLVGFFTDDFDEAYILNTLAINRRLEILKSVADLGLKIYGTTNWPDALSYSWRLAMSYTPQEITTRTEIESVYNSSLININVSHAQARGGLPWRVFDTMACSGVLVSDVQADLKNLFGKYVDIPTYNTAADARNLCQRLLDNVKEREEINKCSRNAIESEHRFKHRLKRLKEILTVDLLPGGKGKLIQLDAAKFTEEKASSISSTTIDFQPDIIPFQVFHSSNGAFSELTSVRQEQPIVAGCPLKFNVVVPKSAQFLRIDIGEHFSIHETPALAIKEKDSDQAPLILDLFKNSLHTHSLSEADGRLICGFDAYAVFKNPLAGNDIVVSFESVLVRAV